MHAAAHDYVARFATDDDIVIVEVGSRHINGTPRDLFPAADYIGIDVKNGPCVDVVADGASYKPKRKADLVICCEVFEHLEHWADIVTNAYDNLVKVGGRVVVTAAGPRRQPHSAVDGGVLRPGEWYANVDPADLAEILEAAGFSDVEVDEAGTDVRATGVK